VNQQKTTQEAVFSVGAAQRLYNEDLPQLELELSSGVGSCSRDLRESPELAVGRIMARNELGCTKMTSCVFLSDSETVINPLPVYD
jgi:hypothetical protein